MNYQSFIFSLLLGAFVFSLSSCDKDEDIVFPEYPQDKLQFSKAVLIELEGAITNIPPIGYVDSAEINVAAGKVLKIENIAATDLETYGNDNSIEIFLNDGVLAYWTSGGEVRQNNLPFWLPTGKYEIKMRVGPVSTGPGDTLSGKAIISAIEYDIVQ